MSVFTLLMAAAAPGPAAPLPLPAISKWNVDYGATNCMLGRKFTDGKSTFILSFRSPPLSDRMDIIVAWPSRDESLATGKAEVIVGAGPPEKTWFSSVRGAADQQRVTRVSVPRTLIAAGGDRIALTIRPGKHPGWTFAIPAMTAGLAALDQCNAAFLKEWGIDLTERSRVPTPAEPIKPSEWFGRGDYPDEAIMNGAQGATTVLLTVRPDGRVGGCRLVVSSGVAGLDEHTCRIVTARARYRPARDAAGAAVAWHDVYRLEWRIGDRWTYEE